MAFSLACDAGKTILRIEGADANVTFKDVYDAGAASVAVDGGGTEDVDFFITEYVEDIYYEILKGIEFGDGTNTLIFNSIKESVYFVDAATWQIAANSTLNIGEIDEAYGTDGSYWSFNYASDYDESPPIHNSSASLGIYSSQIHNRNTTRFYCVGGTLTIRNSIYNSISSQTGGYLALGSGATIDIKGLYCNSVSIGIRMGAVPVAADDMWFHDCGTGVSYYVTDTSVQVKNVKFTDNTTKAIAGNSGAELILVDLDEHLDAGVLTISSDGASIIEQYGIDIEVLDSEYVPIENASVKHWISESTDGGTTWGVYTYVAEYITDSDGLTGIQDFNYAVFEDIAETRTDYQHKIEITASGQNKQIFNNIRPDGCTMPAQFQPARGIFFHGNRNRMAF
jgi:hypothetical protein